jgi:hypothetical protein
MFSNIFFLNFVSSPFISADYNLLTFLFVHTILMDRVLKRNYGWGRTHFGRHKKRQNDLLCYISSRPSKSNIWNDEWRQFCVRFKVLTAASTKFRVFWDILLCSQINVDIDLTTPQYIPEDSELHTKNILICSQICQEGHSSTIVMTLVLLIVRVTWP